MKTLIALLMVVGLMGSATYLPANAAQQLDPDVRDRVTAAAVQVAIDAWYTEEDGDTGAAPITIGSGTIVSPEGLVVTNAHVVDETTRREVFQDYERHWLEQYPTDTLEFYPETMLLLASDGFRPPRLSYIAEIIQVDVDADIAILQIIDSVEPAPFPYISLGDSTELRLGDPIYVFGYPMSGGDALTFTTGVVSGFNFENPDDAFPAWINSDAVMSGGNSGGTAVNSRGELIGIPTEGAKLDCRPGDTNGDGEFTSEDVGCIPTGGSIGRLRPVNLAAEVLARVEGRTSAQTLPTATPTRRPPTATAVPPTPTPDDYWASFFTDFPDPTEVLEDQNGVRIVGGDGEMSISFAWANLDTYRYYVSMPTQSRDYFMRTNVKSTSGSGEVFLAVNSVAEGHQWVFAVDPGYGTWSLWRLNDQGTLFFYWIEPRYLPSSASGRLQSLEVQVLRGTPHFLVNGVDVSYASGLEMPYIAAPREYLWGARSIDGPFEVVYSSIAAGEVR